MKYKLIQPEYLPNHNLSKKKRYISPIDKDNLKKQPKLLLRKKYEKIVQDELFLNQEESRGNKQI